MGSVVCLLVEVSKSWANLETAVYCAPCGLCGAEWLGEQPADSHSFFTNRPTSAIILKNVFRLRIEKRPG